MQLLIIRYLICDFCRTDEKNNLGISAEVISCLMDTFTGGAQMRPNQHRKHILSQMFAFVKLYFAARLPGLCIWFSRCTQATNHREYSAARTALPPGLILAALCCR